MRVVLPGHLCVLADVDGELTLPAIAPVTIGSVLDAVEEAYPVLRGAIRDHDAGARRPYVRYFACEQDFSLDPPGTRLPEPVADGREPFLIVGAIAGG
ncbi:MoaD/ThiS family protein [Tomitella fengzijianii]|uniref:MoaD/ThiS family protein n=1 Tax=Tomitella fengzijianii TaxID=2597660 RepID=A0A516X743_9ACTN|nr:MoaD/ThiS family protein [Tomitella fengzijianii]